MLFHRWPLLFGSFFLSPLVARDVITPQAFAWLETGSPSDMAQSTRPPNISLPPRDKVEFDTFLGEIAREITKEELDQMKFICARQCNYNLPRGEFDAIESQHEFLRFLSQQDKICQEDMSYLVWLLRTVGCIKLAVSIEKHGKILVKTCVQIDLLRLNKTFIVFPLWMMRIDRSRINSCHVFDKIKVDLAVSAWKKVSDKDKCAKIGNRFHGRRVCSCKLQQHRMMFDWQ